MKLKQQHKNDCIFGVISQQQETWVDDLSSGSNNSFEVIKERGSVIGPEGIKPRFQSIN
jgi:hypothetical protein